MRRIPRATSGPSADFRAVSRTERLVVEVKSKDPDEDFARQLRVGSRAESEAPIARTNVLSARVGEAADQLAATAPRDKSLLRLVAFVAAQDDPDLQVEQFQRTIYGSVELLREGESRVRSVPCLYFTFSDFFRLPEVDGALVISPRGGRLCLNAFSARCAQLRATVLHARLAVSGAVTDPEVDERTGKLMIADTDIDRRNEAAVLAFVRKKYDRPELFAVAPKRIRVAVKVPWESTRGG